MHAYRPDVDGLRAVAVLAVLGYHAFPGAMPGGFAGVDVFFVISGFLITGIILGDLEAGRFTLAGFYWRRIRRIFPALILVLAAVLLLGWQVLLPDEFRTLGKHVAAGAGFVSNIALWREAGYFDAAAELKPLLHLWSLGIEEQYYLLWPLALLFFFRRSLLLWLIVGVAAASFALNVAMVGGHAKAAFFLPVTRFWELLAGALLAYSGSSKTSHIKAILGGGLVIAGFALLNGERAFPGWWALLPVAGTALLISAGPSAWVNRAILSRPAVVYVGLISYPLYLWHWPLLSYARIVQGGEPPLGVRCALLALAGVLAMLTYEMVEKPIRRGRIGLLARRAVPGLATAMCMLGLAGVLAQREQMVPHSASIPLAAEIARAASDWGYDADRVIRGDSPRAVLFFGDSHMQHYLPRIQRLAAEHRAPLRTVIFKTEGGCAPVPGVERKRSRCAQFVADGFRIAHDPKVDTVVIAASWVGFINRGDYYKLGAEDAAPLKILSPGTEWVLQGFEAELAELTKEGKHVVLVLSSPRGTSFAPKSVVQRDWMALHLHSFAPMPRKTLSALTHPIDDRLRAIGAHVGATVIDPTEFLCGPSDCPAVDEKGQPLYMDESHIRASVARSRINVLDQFVYLQKPQS
jgi:peptidoglycan/LPS O-acetylase OafA/YrhL